MDEAERIERLKSENEQLRIALEELKILNEIATAISSTLSLEQVMELMIKKCIKHLKAKQCAIMLLDPEDKDRPFHTMIRKADSSSATLPYRLDTQLMGWMLKNRKPLLINDFSEFNQIRLAPKDSGGIKSVLSAPLLLKGHMIGSLNIFNKQSPGGFTEADTRLLAIIATESAQVIENARLYEEERALLCMQDEMKMARKIQADLLPKSPPAVIGYDIAGISIPATLVGGDYFDFIRIDEHRLGLCLGDVSGKGMPAALLMANVQATLRSQAISCAGPCECLARSNDLLLASTDLERYATLFYGVLDTREHTIHYCNAGHNPPFVFRKSGEPERLKIGGTVVGCFGATDYSDARVAIRPGDVLVMYSDGVTEARDGRGEEFGESGIADVIVSSIDDPAESLLLKLIDMVKAHVGQAPPGDDITVVVVKRCK
ncbi:GAF domain-containing SpoIIE family protein phosphatase [Candidatus Eisenbacteria bacterium]|uniref:GAF domain-containing SpoIIE family protein phosphatase n=1 Tax=Eiseniibacteriota bacterium TaxID=2212470 RepID=A0ABV6YPV8_UNCEI